MADIIEEETERESSPHRKWRLMLLCLFWLVLASNSVSFSHPPVGPVKAPALQIPSAGKGPSTGGISPQARGRSREKPLGYTVNDVADPAGGQVRFVDLSGMASVAASGLSAVEVPVPTSKGGPPMEYTTGYAKASLPVAGVRGRLALVNDQERGWWYDSGREWLKMLPWVAAEDFGLSVKGSAASNTTALINAMAAAALSSRYRTVLMPPGTFAINAFTTPKVFNLVLRGAGSGYSYGGQAGIATVLQFNAGTTGITPTAAFSPDGPYLHLEDFVVDGHGVLATGILVRNQMTVHRVLVTGCTREGFLGDGLNQSHLDQVAAVGNPGDGLRIGPDRRTPSTIFSISRSNFRSNRKGMVLKAGSHFAVRDTVIESNSDYGLYIYQPNRGEVSYGTFDSLWLENNSTALEAGNKYQAVLDAQTLDNAHSPAFHMFRNCAFNNAGNQRSLRIAAARWTTFDHCAFLGGGQADGIVIARDYGRETTFIERNGGPSRASLWAQGALTVERSSRDGQWTSPPYSAGNFAANGSMTWTVDSADVDTYEYMVTGRTMTMNFVLGRTSIGGTPSFELRIALPSGYRIAKSVIIGGLHVVNNNSQNTGLIHAQTGHTYLSLYLATDPAFSATNWPPSTKATSVRGSITFEVY